MLCRESFFFLLVKFNFTFYSLNKTERLFREVFLCAILLFVIEHTTFLDKVQLENNLRLKVLLENTSILVWGYYKWNLNWKSNEWSKENIVHLSIVWGNCMKIEPLLLVHCNAVQSRLIGKLFVGTFATH